MHELKFTLKQHTPLIHFQWQQDGATLRATEVKPKLDRFIKEYFCNLNQAIEDSWYSDKDQRGLDYKLKIEITGEVQKYFISSNPRSGRQDDERRRIIAEEFDAEYIYSTQYFGSNENLKQGAIEKKDQVKLGLKSDGVTIRIQSFNKGLLDFLRKNDGEIVKAFFVLNSFGTRQTKGFGCFLPPGVKEAEIKRYLTFDKNITGAFKKRSTHSFVEKLQTIAADYGLLKRGNSEVLDQAGRVRQPYEKSKLWEYLCANQGLRWEKRKIKNSLPTAVFNTLKHQTHTHRIDDCPGAEDNNQYMYIRALLGLAEQYEFVRKERTDPRLKVKIADSSPDEYKMERFQSPVRYIVADDCIYLIATRVPDIVHSYQDSRGNTHMRQISFTAIGMPGFSLEIPSSFNLYDFIKRKSGYTEL